VSAPDEDPRLTAGVDLIRRTGAQSFQLRYCDDAAPTAKLHVTRLELARGGQDDEQLRQGMLARYRARTALGTLDQEQDPDAAEVQDPGTKVSDADALVDYVNDVGLVAGHPAKATRNKDGSVTIDVAVPATP
jgi:hypothetical protein